MASSSSNIPPAKASSSPSPPPSPSKLEQRQGKQKLLFKKKTVRPAKKRVIRRLEPMILAGKTTSGLQLNDDIDNTRMSQQCGSSGHGEVKSPAMVRAIEVPSTLSGSSGHGEVKSPAMDRAKEIQEKLSKDYQSFVKYMYRSHVTVGFWLSLPKSFCDSYLPEQDESITLVDEGGNECNTNYLYDNHGLSGGWKGFSLAHNLVEGDVLVFQLIEPLKFKVYIVRASQTAEANVAQAKTLEINVNDAEMIAGEDMCVEVHEKGTKASDSEHVEEGTGLAKPILQFKDVDGFHSFSIIVDGLAIDTDIPLNLLYTYYKLCVDQKLFLHTDLIKGLNSKLAAGIISETATIADAIKPAKLTVSLECLQSWDRTLKAFEDMGMKVGFLRARINKLESLLYEQHEIFRSKKQEQNRLEEKIKVVESEQVKRYEAKKAVDDEIEALMVKISSLEVTLKNTAAAPSASW